MKVSVICFSLVLFVFLVSRFVFCPSYGNPGSNAGRLGTVAWCLLAEFSPILLLSFYFKF